MVTKPKSGPKAVDAGALDMQTRPLGSGIDPNRIAEPSDDTPAEKEFDPFHFGVTELPAGMRKALIEAELPTVPADQLFDTSPPNTRYAAPPPKDTTPARDSLPAVNAPKVLAIPLQSRRNVVLGFVAVAVVLLVIVIASSATRPTVSAPANSSSTLAAQPSAEPHPPLTAAATSASKQAPSLSAAPPPDARLPEPAQAHEPKTSAARDRTPRVGSPPYSRPAPAAVVSSTPIASGAPATPRKGSSVESMVLPKPD